MVYLMLPIGDVLFLYISFAYARNLFPLIYFFWVYSHTSHRRRFLPYPYFLKRCVPMRRLSAESLCGFHWRLKLSLQTLVNDLG